MRIAVGGIEHESSNWSPRETHLEEFFNNTRSATTEELKVRPGDANTIVDGLLKGTREQGGQVVPLVWCQAPSGHQPTLETHQRLKEELLMPLRAAAPVDGVLLSLHGSYSVQGLEDGDGDVLVDVRQVVGPDCPIIAVHDLHSNISETMVQNATALIVEDTYPHTDMAERGIEAAKMMAGTIRGEIRPTLGWRSIPLFWAAVKMISAEQPMKELIDKLHELETQTGILTASVGVGYQWADVACAGASTLVVTDGDEQAAQDYADNLAQWIWQRRDDWQCPLLSPADALERGEAIGKYPIILADQADNPGGGAPSDSTEILQLFLDRKLQDAAVLYIVDPDAAAQATAAGVGAVVDLDVGGKSLAPGGDPVKMTAEVLAINDGKFVYDGPMFENLVGHHGNSALIRQDGVYVVIISEPHQPIDLACPRSLGIDCQNLRYICVKSTGHFRSGFGSIAGSIFNVDASGALTQHFSTLPFTRLGRKVYPMDPDTVFEV